jgi:hypothetical protein
MNGLLAAGMVVAPVYALLTAATGVWWSLSLLLGLLLIAELVLSRSLHTPPDGTPVRRRDWLVPAGLRSYPGLALLYGACAVICITAPHHVTGSASRIHLSLLVLAEVAFWAALVQGFRVVFAIIDGMRSWRRAVSAGLFTIAVIILALSASIGRFDVMHAGLYLLAAIGCAALLPIDARPGHEQIALAPLAVTGGIITLFPVSLGLSRFGYDIVVRTGLTPFEMFVGVAVVGAVACMLLLPVVIRNWGVPEYFDRPVGRNGEPPRLGYSSAAAVPSAPAEPGVPPPREPHVRGDGPGQGSAGPLDHHGPQRPTGRSGP